MESQEENTPQVCETPFSIEDPPDRSENEDDSVTTHEEIIAPVRQSPAIQGFQSPSNSRLFSKTGFQMQREQDGKQLSRTTIKRPIFRGQTFDALQIQPQLSTSKNINSGVLSPLSSCNLISQQPQIIPGTTQERFVIDSQNKLIGSIKLPDIRQNQNFNKLSLMITSTGQQQAPNHQKPIGQAKWRKQLTDGRKSSQMVKLDLNRSTTQPVRKISTVIPQNTGYLNEISPTKVFTRRGQRKTSQNSTQYPKQTLQKI